MVLQARGKNRQIHSKNTHCRWKETSFITIFIRYKTTGEKKIESESIPVTSERMKRKWECKKTEERKSMKDEKVSWKAFFILPSIFGHIILRIVDPSSSSFSFSFQAKNSIQFIYFIISAISQFLQFHFWKTFSSSISLFCVWEKYREIFSFFISQFNNNLCVCEIFC